MILKTGDLTNLGGKCVWCLAEDKWEVQRTDEIPYKSTYKETIVYLKCVNVVEYVSTPGVMEKCGNAKEVALNTSHEQTPLVELDVET